MNKTKRLGLMLTEREKSWVLSLAELEGGLTQAALIRRLIRKAAMEYGFQSTGFYRDAPNGKTHSETKLISKETTS